MTDFKRRIEKVRGWQFMVGAIVPDWLKVSDEDAVQLRVSDSEGGVYGAILGDWIVKMPDGSFEVRTTEEFHEEFEPDEEKNWR